MIVGWLISALAADPPKDVEPSGPPAVWARVDRGSVVVLRPLGGAWAFGFDNEGLPDGSEPPFRTAFRAALDGREAEYDFAAVFIAENLPVQIQGALAFNQTFNRDFEGIGVLPIEFDVPVRGALYLNQPSRWDDFSDAIDKYVLNHELGHFWLARAQVDLGGGRSAITLGRQGAHWSYFMHTGGSPMEGNAWIDNGDGSFTSDPTVSGDFSDLDLYLMGLLPADEVAPWFLIEPTEAFGRTPTDSPDHYAPEPQSRTIFGRRVDLTIDDVIAAEGPRGGPAPSSFRILTLLVAGPEEILTPGDFDRIEDLQARWVTYWSEATRERSDISFDIDDEGLQMPPPADPRWIPGGAR